MHEYTAVLLRQTTSTVKLKLDHLLPQIWGKPQITTEQLLSVLSAEDICTLHIEIVPFLLIQILPDYYLHLNELEYYCSLANELECTLKNIGISKIFLKKLIIVFNKNALK